MTARVPLAVVSMVLLLTAAFGREVPAKADPRPADPDKGQDVLFLAPGRPVLLRLHVEVDGKPLHEAHRTATEQYLKALFQFLDRDGDGFLSEAEARHVPPPLISLPDGTNDSVHVAFNFRALDADGDGKVTPAELSEYFQFFGGGAFVHQFHTAAGPGAVLNQRLFELLDINKDGKLSRDEIANAARVLAKLDADGDETVIPEEVGREFLPVPIRGDDAVQPPAPAPAPVNRDFLVLSDELPASEVARALLARYATDPLPLETRKLSRKEFAVEPDLFARLDKNGDGLLDLGELLSFADRPADVELRVRLGERRRGATLLEVLRPTGKVPLASAVLKSGAGGVILRLGAARVELNCDRSRLNPHFFTTTRASYIRAFHTADTDGNGSLDRREAARSAYFRDAFDALDRNGDGRLDEKEVLHYVDGVLALEARALAARSSLLISQPGTGLWDLLDRNRDGRLGLREVRMAPKLLAALDRNGDGVVDASEVPAAYQLALGLGQASFNRLSGDVLVELSPLGRMAYPPDTLGGGPVWFRKMDRNGDGDVSPREFLGTPEAFKKLDLDGDGLLSRAEAEAAEALRKLKK